MPASKKIYFDPANPPVHLLYNEHQVIPRPALQGLIRALLSKWNVDDDEKARLEKIVLMIAETLSDPRLVKQCEDDVSINKQASVSEAAAYIKRNIAKNSRPCPTAILQAQAQFVDAQVQLIFAKIKKGARNSAHLALTLRENWEPLHQKMILPFLCSGSHQHPSALPDAETFRSWSRISQPSRLRNAILTYYHGLKSPQYVGQLLAGRIK